MTWLGSAWATFAAASVTYGAIVGIIYKLGEKSGAFLSDGWLKRIKAFPQATPLTELLNSCIHMTIIVIDNLLIFTRTIYLFVPSILRSAALSVCMFAILAYPLRNLITYASLVTSLLSDVAEPYRSSLLFMSFIITSLISDFLSFSKSRTLIDYSARAMSLKRLLLSGVSDVLLSIIICLIVYVAVTSFMVNTVEAVQNILGDFKGTTSGLISDVPFLAVILGPYAVAAVVLYIFRSCFSSVTIVSLFVALMFIFDVGMNIIHADLDNGLLSFLFDAVADLLDAPMQFGFSPFIFALASSLGIGFIAIMTLLIQVMALLVNRLEVKGVWSFLNFNKPTIAYSVITIIVITVVYWPIVLLLEIA
jgi:hypothetical protein